MPESLILLTAGETTTACLPSTAQEVSSAWRHDLLFPHGVFFHRMMHLSADMVEEIGVRRYLTRNRVETVSLSLLMDARLKSTGNRSTLLHLEPNFHEIPPLLDTQLFYGNLLLILTIDGSTIIPLNKRQYHTILNSHVTDSISRQSTTKRTLFGSSSYEFSCTPDSGSAEPMSISDIEIESMDCSSDESDDESDGSPACTSSRRRVKFCDTKSSKKKEFLNICLNAQPTIQRRALPVRPVF